jgi:hypothetical protein
MKDSSGFQPSVLGKHFAILQEKKTKTKKRFARDKSAALL